MAQKTVLQIVGGETPYKLVRSYDFLYTPVDLCQLQFEGYIYHVNEIEDIISGSDITRYIRFQRTRKMQD